MQSQRPDHVAVPRQLSAAAVFAEPAMLTAGERGWTVVDGFGGADGNAKHTILWPQPPGTRFGVVVCRNVDLTRPVAVGRRPAQRKFAAIPCHPLDLGIPVGTGPSS